MYTRMVMGRSLNRAYRGWRIHAAFWHVCGLESWKLRRQLSFIDILLVYIVNLTYRIHCTKRNVCATREPFENNKHKSRGVDPRAAGSTKPRSESVVLLSHYCFHRQKHWIRVLGFTGIRTGPIRGGDR